MGLRDGLLQSIVLGASTYWKLDFQGLADEIRISWSDVHVNLGYSGGSHAVFLYHGMHQLRLAALGYV